jgi:fructose/tagatose bisphosphate aldolase
VAEPATTPPLSSRDVALAEQLARLLVGQFRRINHPVISHSDHGQNLTTAKPAAETATA